MIAADNLAPVKRALVRLSGMAASPQEVFSPRVPVTRQVETADNGRFDFANLPDGSYRLTIEPQNRFVRPSRPREATLTDGQTVEVTIRLERTGAIAGRIVDDNGDSVLGSQLPALRRNDLDRHVMPVGFASPATTDDLGQFRLFNLPPGEYFVVATYTPSHRDPDAAARSGYGTTYYPGAVALRDAGRVLVRAGQDTASIDFRLAPSNLARVVINAADSRGLPLGRHAQMSLASVGDVILATSVRHTNQRDDGTFVFRDVSPGDYYVVATTSPLQEESAYVNLSVGSDDVSLNVQTNSDARVSGRVVIERQSRRAHSGLPRPRAWVSANRPPRKFGPTYEQVSPSEVFETDRFELKGLRGPMVLSAELAGGALISILRGGEEIAGKTLEFNGTEVIDDVVVTLTADVATVDLTITSTIAQDEPEPVLVVLFSEDPSLWHQGFLQYARTSVSRRAQPPAAGQLAQAEAANAHLELGRMVPGRYLAVAVHDSDINYPTGPQMLTRLRPLAVPVTLASGQMAKVLLGVVQITP